MPQTRRARGIRMADDVHRRLKARAAELGVTMEDLLDDILRKELGIVTMALTWQVIEDGGGGLYLAVFEGDDLIYYADQYEFDPVALREAVEVLRGGGDPRTEGWDLPQWIVDGDHDINAVYDDLTSYEYGWQVVADQDGTYYDRMGAAAQRAFGLMPMEIKDIRIALRQGRWDATYSDGDGGPERKAILIPWDDLHAMAGREFDGDPQEAETVISYLLAAGAPAWVRDANEWSEEAGWGLIGPAVEEE